LSAPSSRPGALSVSKSLTSSANLSQRSKETGPKKGHKWERDQVVWDSGDRSGRSLLCILIGLLLIGIASTVPGGLNPASADVRVLDSRFTIVVRTGPGDMRQVPGTRVPLLPGRACYGWGVRLDDPPKLLKFKEIFTLPSALADWGTDRDFSTSKIIQGGKAAVTERFTTPKEGWVENIWCVGASDPAGNHSFEIFIDEVPVKTFPFEVVPVR